MQEQTYTLQDVSGVIKRRGKLISRTILTLILLSVVGAYSLENRYRSAGIIMIERPEISERFIRETYLDSNREQRIARINDEVMTRKNLAVVVEKHDLYRDLRLDDAPESVVPELRENFELELFYAEADPRNRNVGEVIGFELSYYHPDPVTARDVSRDIVNLFQEGNRQRRQQAYQETAAALLKQADNLEQQVSLAEKQLAGFKTRFPGALPEDRNYNRQIIERKANDLDGLDREIRSLQERKTLLQSQLAQINPWMAAIGPDGDVISGSGDHLANLQAEYLRLLGSYSANHPDVQRLRREIQAMSGGVSNPALRLAAEVELSSKQLELDVAKQQFSADHPDVRILERSIGALEQQLAAMPAAESIAQPPNNPTYINLQLQLDAVNNELDALKFDRVQVQAELVILEDRVQVAPEVEREYLNLTRDLGLARKQYEETKTRQMTVERAGVLQEEDLSERYVITSYPSLSYDPAFPNRPLIISVGIFLAITLGITIGIVAEAVDGSIRSTRDVQAILQMPPIAAIPVITTTTDVAVTKRNTILRMIIMTATIASVIFYVQMQQTGAI